MMCPARFFQGIWCWKGNAIVCIHTTWLAMVLRCTCCMCVSHVRTTCAYPSVWIFPRLWITRGHDTAPPRRQGVLCVASVEFTEMYIPSRTTLAAVPPDSVARSEDMWRYRTAGMHRSACLVARKADFRSSGWQGRHAALVAQCAVGVVLHPKRRPCAIRMRRTQLTRFPEKV